MLPAIDDKLNSTDKVDLSLPYREILGGLNYVANWTRPDIASIVSQLSRFCNQPTATHMNIAKQVLRYLNTTKDLPLHLGKLDDTDLLAYSDANYAPATDSKRKSQSGGVLKLAGSTVSWFSRKQKTVSTSTTTAEFYALSEVTKDVLWMQKLLEELSITVQYPTPVFEDNQPVIAIVRNQRSPSDAKHIEVKHYFVLDYHAKGYINVTYMDTDHQLADGLTKVKSNPRDRAELLGLQRF